MRRHRILARAVAALLCACTIQAAAQNIPPAPAPAPADESVLSPQRWREVETAVDRALAWLATQQQADGSFPVPDGDQPGVTGLCAMAFLARGHLPGDSGFGPVITKAVDYTLACQKPNGLISRLAPTAGWSDDDANPAKAGAYCHAIAGILLTEVYGMAPPEQTERIRAAIEKALDFSHNLQNKPKRPEDRGGFRYVAPYPIPVESDLSITSWHLMFLRSAQNAGFAVPVKNIDAAMDYVRGCYLPHLGTFYYGESQAQHSRGMAGAGILSLALGGEHNSPMARSAAAWLLRQPFEPYNSATIASDRYHYSVYYATLGMFQMGGDSWNTFYPRMVDILLKNQQADGSWPPEAIRDAFLGSVYSTAMVVNALCVPYQLLPVYQR